MTNRRIAIYGGSFDPPHIGHEALARLAVRIFALDALLVVPAIVPVHRSLSNRVDAATKLAWLHAIWQDEPHITVMDWEDARPTPTIETLRRFTTHYHDVVPLLLMGSDAAAGIDRWIDYPNHRSLCNLAVFQRKGETMVNPKGWNLQSVAQWKAAPNRGCGDLFVVDCLLPDVSATMVRHALQRGDRTHNWVPDVIRGDVDRLYTRRKGEEII